MAKELSPQQCYQTAVDALADMVLAYLARKIHPVPAEMLEWIAEFDLSEECQRLDVERLSEKVVNGPWERLV